MYTLRIKNELGKEITLTQRESEFQIIEITGLNPPKAQINLRKIAGKNGSAYSSSTLEERNIVIKIKINGDVEYNRNYLYDYFVDGEHCTLYYKNGIRNVFIKGCVESTNVNLFTNKEIAQVSIICYEPFFKGMDEIIDDVSRSTGKFTFPFAINTPIEFSTMEIDSATNVYNDGDSECGMLIEGVIGVEGEQLIISSAYGGSFEINRNFQVGDKIVINTEEGNKYCHLIRGDEEINILRNVKLTSTYFTLRKGDNVFSYEYDGGHEGISIQYRHRNNYRGV